MMERLGFRGGLASCIAASKLGLSHYEVATSSIRGNGNFAPDAITLAEKLSKAGKTLVFDQGIPPG